VPEPLLLPTPRSWTPIAGTCNAPTRIATHRSAHPPQAYRLELSQDGVRIDCSEPIGERHARATLAQLVAQGSPCCVIEDAPAFATRGVMLDISRCRVPTMAELQLLITTLAGWKINHLELYVEHTVAYREHRLAWEGWDPLTHDEIRTLGRLCAANGIALVANQNTLGHLEHWFTHPRYAAMAEIAPGQSWDFGGIVTKTGPFSLCPSDPAALPFVTGLLDELLPLFDAPQVNIGCDEAYDLGQGRSRERVAAQGRANVYLDWVAQVCAVARRHGKRPAFWADIALEHPDALDRLPADLLALCWGYEPDAPFARWVELVRAAGREAWVCPGTGCWLTWTGRTTERRANLLAAAEQGLAAGATGWLATAWGDDGHRQPWPVTLHALAEAAHRAWSGTAAFDAQAAGLHAFRKPALGVWLDHFGDVDRDLRRISGAKGGVLRNRSALFADLHKPWRDPAPGSAAAYEACADSLDELADDLPVYGGQIAEELIHAGRLARLAAEAGWLKRHAPDDLVARRICADELDALTDEHRRLWLKRARPGGLERSCARYTAVSSSWRSA
jgi:hexosaminidase